MAGGRWAEAGRYTVGVPTKRGETRMVDRGTGDGQGLGEALTHPAWPQEQGFPLI